MATRNNGPVAVPAVALVLTLAAIALNPQDSLASRVDVHQDPVDETATLQGPEVREATRGDQGASDSVDEITGQGGSVAALAIPNFLNAHPPPNSG